MNEPIDVLVLTGFLGAGKTTLLNRMLTSPGAKRIAVLVNEFGDIGIDHDLLFNGPQQSVTLSNGCLCCRLDGGLLQSLLSIAERTEALDTLVIELSGLADPVPVLETLCADLRLCRAFRLRGVVALADARHILGQLDGLPLARRQIAMADRILLNKTDLASEADLDRAEAALRAISRHAPIGRVRDCDTDIGALLEMTPLSARTAPDSGPTHARAASVSLALEGAIDALKFGRWMQALAGAPAPLWRIKGILNLWGDDDQFWFQAVGSEYDCRPGRAWCEGELRQSRLVFIGEQLDEPALDQGLRGCLTSAAPPSAGGADRFGRWHQEIAPQRLDQIKFWMRQNFGFPAHVPILIKEVPCAKPDCPPVETAIMALVEGAPPRLFKVRASINELTFDQVYDLMENPMPCC
jgi:G3E family GTPase